MPRGPRRAAVLLDGQRPRPEPHREVIDIVSDGASCPVRVRIDTGSHPILLAAWEGSLSERGRGSCADRVGTGPVPRLSLSCVQRGYFQSAEGHRGHRGRVPGAGDLPAEEGAAVTRAPRGGGDRHAGWPVLGSSLALHRASHGVDPLTVGRRGPDGLLRGAIRTGGVRAGQSGPLPR